MKKRTQKLPYYLIAILLLSACSGARYGQRTLRVKPYKSLTTKTTVSVKREAHNETAVHSKQNDAQTPMQDVQSLARRVNTEQHSNADEKTKRLGVLESPEIVDEALEISQPTDSIPNLASDVAYRKAQYEKANRLAKLGLAFSIGILVPAIGFFLFLIGYITTIRAFRIYRRYENPGVEEKFEMAKWTFIISTILIAAGIVSGIYILLLFF